MGSPAKRHLNGPRVANHFLLNGYFHTKLYCSVSSPYFPLMTNIVNGAKSAHLKYRHSEVKLYHNLAVHEGGHLDIDTAAQFLT